MCCFFMSLVLILCVSFVPPKYIESNGLTFCGGINADVAELVLKNTTCKRLSRQSIYRWFIFVAFAPIHKAVVVSCLCVSTPTNSNLNGYLHHFFHFSALPLDIRWQLHFPCFTCEFIFRFSFADVYGVVTAAAVAVAAALWERAIDLDAFSISHNSMYRNTTVYCVQ